MLCNGDAGESPDGRQAVFRGNHRRNADPPGRNRSLCLSVHAEAECENRRPDGPFFFLVSGLVLTLFCSPLTKLAGLFGDIWLQYRIQMLDPEAYAGLGIKTRRPPGGHQGEARAKSLVFIFLESLERTHCDDNVFPGLTPNINRLRKEAICFDNNDNAPNADYSFGGMYAALTGSVLINQHLSAGLNGGVNPHIGSRLSSFPLDSAQSRIPPGFHPGAGGEVRRMINVLLNREGFDEAISCGDNRSRRQETGGVLPSGSCLNMRCPGTGSWSPPGSRSTSCFIRSIPMSRTAS